VSSFEGDDKVIRDRAVRLFTFLKELALLKTKVTRDLRAYDEVVWFNDVPEYKGIFSILSGQSSDTQDVVWLEVRRQKEPQKPPIPTSCVEWLDETLEDNDTPTRPCLRHEIPTDDAEIKLARLDDHPEIGREWELYIKDNWQPWVEAHKSWKAANALYFRLFSIYEQLKKLGERYELILGLGLLTWETPQNQIIRRHIVVGDAYLTFDADRAKFMLQSAPDGVKLRFELEMVEQSYLPSPDQQKEIEDRLGLTQESPWSREEIHGILRSWIQSARADGIYADSLIPPEGCTTIPTVTFAPAIILRQRTQRSQVQCFTNIVEQIKKGGKIPSGVSLLCEVSDSIPMLEDGVSNPEGEKPVDTSTYLPLLVNEEQLQVVDLVRNRRGILVQGPPGTGKSHTIANLICCLLAQGKRVLVTSQTPRALKVLKEKIPAEIAALCVTLLGNDQAARDELKGSVEGINQKYSEWNPASSRGRIASLELQLLETQKHTADTNRLLRELREIETYQHQVADRAYRGTAQQIALRIREEESTFSWLEDNVGEEQPFPLQGAEFGELVQLFREIPDNRCSELKQSVISQQDVPDVAQYIKMIDDEKAAKQNLDAYGSRSHSLRFSTLEKLPEDKIEALGTSVQALTVAVSSIKERFTWVAQAVSDMLSDNDTPWKKLHAFLVDHLEHLREKANTAQTCNISFPENIDISKLRFDATELLNHLQKGGRLGWKCLAPQVVKRTRYIMKEVSINGRQCSTIETLALLTTYLDALAEIDNLWSAFKGIDKREEGSLLVQLGYLEEHLEALETILNLEDLLNAAKANVKIANLAEPQWHKIEELEELIIDLNAVKAEYVYKRANSAIEDTIQKVRIVQADPRAHALNQEFLVALQRRDAQALASCLDKLDTFERDRERLNRRSQLTKSLKEAAPKLVSQLQSTFADNIWGQRAGDFELAWSWKRADEWLARFNREHNKKKLEAELEKLREDKQKTTSKLVAAKAWNNCLSSLTENERANLMAWATEMKKIGKGTGPRAPIHRKQAQKYMDECKKAIPAWIMPLYRVFETVYPEPETFDVIIIDEASQTGPEGLVIQYLAKQCIVVGDSEQISPAAVGVDLNNVDLMVKRHLAEIPFKDLYGPETSLFAHASIRFGGRVVLREHFRCMPEIIQFSNNLCYRDTPLKPLRQYPPKRLEPIVVRHVENGYREGPPDRAINRPEAEALVNAILEFCSGKDYVDKTMGVISLQGEAQAKLIESILLNSMEPSELERRKVVCGDAYAFQGDERDVMFLSMVAAPNERIGALVGEADKRRFNVAASRAKDQMVLFHTATLSDLNPECMRYKLLEYCLNPSILPTVEGIDLAKLRGLACGSDRKQGAQPAPFDSWFEVDVFLNIVERRFRVIPQYQVAGYSIDLVIEGTKNRLAVECDGDEWHGIEQYEKDLSRQRILERCGLRFWRVRGCEYYRDPSRSLDSLWTTLSETGIQPMSGLGFVKENSSDKSPDDKATTIIGADKPESISMLSPNIEAGEVSSQHPDEPETAKESSFDLVDFLTRRQIEFKDNRPKGGSLWLIGGNELAPVISELKAKGISFSYLPRGGRVSGHRPAWYCTTEM
jgi:very-short-patch-repair endonuclease